MAWALTGSERAHEPSAKKPKIGIEAEPLLLDDGNSDNLHVKGMADNSRCQVCHLNLVAEELAVKHARVGSPALCLLRCGHKTMLSSPQSRAELCSHMARGQSGKA